MMKTFMCFFAVLVFGCAGFSGCSKNENGEPEKGKMETMTDRAADEAVKMIRTPMDQARSAKDMEDTRLRDMEEGMKEN